MADYGFIWPIGFQLFSLKKHICFPSICIKVLSVQRGSEYRTRLVFKWSKVAQSPNRPVFACRWNTGQSLVWYSNGDLNTRPPFEYLTSEYWTSKSSLFRSPLYIWECAIIKLVFVNKRTISFFFCELQLCCWQLCWQLAVARLPDGVTFPVEAPNDRCRTRVVVSCNLAYLPTTKNMTD